MVPQESERRLLLLANPQALPREIRPVPIQTTVVEEVRQEALVFPDYAPSVRTIHSGLPPTTYASVASSRFEPVRRDRVTQYPNYETTVPARQTHPTPVYTPPTPNLHPNYNTPRVVFGSSQSTAIYQQQTPDYGQSDDSSGDEDWSGTVLVVAAVAVCGLITWWRW